MSDVLFCCVVLREMFQSFLFAMVFFCVLSCVARVCVSLFMNSHECIYVHVLENVGVNMNVFRMHMCVYGNCL
jgi:hypothetical protein